MGEKVHGHHPACRESSHIVQPIPPAGRQEPNPLVDLWRAEYTAAFKSANRMAAIEGFRWTGFDSIELLEPVESHEGEGEQGQTRPSEDSETEDE